MKKGFLAVAVVAAALAAPAVANADSIVFVKDYNVWLVAPDGSKLTQVTTGRYRFASAPNVVCTVPSPASM